MKDDERDMPLVALGADGRYPAESPAGEIDLGKAPALGRRARLLAGMITAATVVTTVVTSTLEPGTSHTGGLLPPL